MGKTFKKNSMHNKYGAEWALLYIRVKQELRRKIEKYAASHGFGLQEACRHIFAEAVNDVLLTSDDYAEIARRMKINEERNERRG